MAVAAATDTAAQIMVTELPIEVGVAAAGPQHATPVVAIDARTAVNFAAASRVVRIHTHTRPVGFIARPVLPAVDAGAQISDVAPFAVETVCASALP